MSKTSPSSVIARIQAVLHSVENVVLVGLLMLMLSMAVLQIVLRNVFESGIHWGDVMVRILVLWVGLLGAMVASRKGRHISIDVVTRYLKPKSVAILQVIVCLFTALICLTVVYHGVIFVKGEYGDAVMAFARVPSWVCLSIIPISFAVMGLRYFLMACVHFMNIFNSKSKFSS